MADRVIAAAFNDYRAAALPPDASGEELRACAAAFMAGVSAGVEAALQVATHVIDAEDAPSEAEYCDVSGIRLDPPRRRQ